MHRSKHLMDIICNEGRNFVDWQKSFREVWEALKVSDLLWINCRTPAILYCKAHYPSSPPELLRVQEDERHHQGGVEAWESWL